MQPEMICDDPAQAFGATAARRFILSGRVQGLGVRPTIYRLAAEMRLTGTVRNTSRGVEIELEASEEQLLRFERELPNQLPEGAVLERFESVSIPAVGRQNFSIVHEPADGPLTARVPQDLAVCAKCVSEINDAKDRRYRYPMTSCTLCGPRYSLIRAMPYERADTTMAKFTFCRSCREEYGHPGDRRFHAQTNACATCGPEVWYREKDWREPTRGARAIRIASEALVSSKIVAVRGLGGYQLLVDATSKQAVDRLRLRKSRRAKPLAVMVESLQAAEDLADLDEMERKALTDPANPIVLVRVKPNTSLATGVHPGLDTVGLMLPTTPLHALLLRDVGRPLVCTSANREGDPLEYQVDEAERNLAGICDAWLHHNREIARPIDDSVVRVIAGRPVTIRMARGLAPLPLSLPSTVPTLAVGGYQKAAAAWSNGAQSVLGPHQGDQETLTARERFLSQVDDCQTLYRFKPRQLVHDMHPEYFSTEWATQQARPTLAVQHHHAHVVAGMLEHGWLDREVLGVAWDGTGYGTDGTIWGGEFLFATATSFRRYARLRPFQLPGGEAAIREPWRAAVSVLSQVMDKEQLARLPCWQGCDVDLSAVLQIHDLPHFSPTTSSAGRLFDAIASIVLGLGHADFDGQLPMRLEAVADHSARGQYEIRLCDAEVLELDWRPLLADLMFDVSGGVDPGTISMRFHRSLAAGIAEICRRVDLPVVLTGGVFQNRLLTELVVEQLAQHTQPVGLPGVIPPNDGGLAAGQLAFAAKIGENNSCA